MKRLSVDKHKHKYVQLKDIYNKVKRNIRVKATRGTKQIDYADYYKIITAYLDEVVNTVAVDREKYILPKKMGKVYIEKREHIRPFHLRIDREESAKQGEIVWYKVPILDDFYNKLIWNRHERYKKYKILPLSRFKKIINKVKEY